ncbi:MAG: glycoside hydrolase family protein [Colwellia sp.]
MNSPSLIVPTMSLIAALLLSACSNRMPSKITEIKKATEQLPNQVCDNKHSTQMKDYFLPMSVGSMSSDIWGANNVLPRNIDNGLESQKMQPAWSYWDGKIIKGSKGKYHLYASRWQGELTHYDWSKSIAVHAVSETPEGPYLKTKQLFNDNNGFGHNITGGVHPDGSYYIVASDAGRKGDIFTSNTIDGVFTFQGTITMDANGQNLEHATANISIIVRPDGKFLLISRAGIIMLSDKLMGPYVAQGKNVWPTIDGYDNSKAEDPILWYSGGLYHITLNWWDIRKARHLVSRDGISHWVDTGIAYDPRLGFEYTNGSKNVWTMLERPGVLVENGHVTHFTFSALDVQKYQDKGSDNHGSKVLVVPFDGKCFDMALDKVIE